MKNKALRIAYKLFLSFLTDSQKEMVNYYKELRDKSMSFGDLFKNERTYIHIGKGKNTEIQVNYQINKLLNDNGYNITDYRKGFAQKFDKKTNKIITFKIGKLLPKLVHDKKYLDELMKIFQERLGTNKKDLQSINFYCCITHNPDDVAGMSTNKNWSSCMKLQDESTERGDYSYTALRQVQFGGMCAYLIDEDDKDIERPYARIAIKRLQNKIGGFIYQSENRIYGDVDLANQMNFKDIVNNELEKSNKITKINNGIYNTSDPLSYSDNNIQKEIFINNKEDLLQLDQNEFKNYGIQYISEIDDNEKRFNEIIYYIENANNIHKSELINFITKYISSRAIYIPESFINKYYEYIDWDYICFKQKLSDDILQKYHKYINWNIIINSNWYSKNKLQQFKKYFNKNNDENNINIDIDQIEQIITDILQNINHYSMRGQYVHTEQRENNMVHVKWEDGCDLAFISGYNLKKAPNLMNFIEKSELFWANQYMKDNPSYNNMSANQFLQYIYDQDQDEKQEWFDYLQEKQAEDEVWFQVNVNFIIMNNNIFSLNIKSTIESISSTDIVFDEKYILDKNNFKEKLNEYINNAFDDIPNG